MASSDDSDSEGRNARIVFGDMPAECPIGFELGFVEELIAGAFVGECRRLEPVVAQVLGLVAVVESFR